MHQADQNHFKCDLPSADIQREHEPSKVSPDALTRRAKVATLKDSLAKNFKIVNRVCKIFAACNHNFAITENKEVFCWGDNSLSLLGVETKIVRTPEKVEFAFKEDEGRA